MKTLNIDSVVGNRLAQIALFERIQAYFNLHPGEMVNWIRLLAAYRQVEPIQLARKLKSAASDIVSRMLSEVEFHIDREAIISERDIRTFVLVGRDSMELAGHLRLDASRILGDIKSKAIAEQMDPLSCVREIRINACTVIEWAFDQTILILEKKKSD